MRYQNIAWWDTAWHVYDEVDGVETRIGIVNERTVHRNGRVLRTWHAHNRHFFTVSPKNGRKHFDSRDEAAAAIPRAPIHHSSEAIARAA